VATPIPASPIYGPVKLTLHIDELHAVQNPEPIGKAEWTLQLRTNGVERWRTDKALSVAQGKSVPIGDEIAFQVAAGTAVIEVEVKGVEKDLLGPDDKASGTFKLHRAGAFERDRGFAVDLHGHNAHVTLLFSVEVEEVEAE